MSEPVEQLVDVGAGRVNAVVSGDGPALVLLHGLAGSWRYWGQTITLLSGRFRVIALDLPGFGCSDATAEPFSLAAAGDALVRCWRALGAERPTVCAHSLAGALAVRAAVRHPEAFGTLALASPAGFRPLPRWQRLRSHWMLPLAGPVLRRESRWEGAVAATPAARRVAFRFIVADPRNVAPDDAVVLLRGAARSRQLASATRAIIAADVVAEARSLRVPVAALWGERDRVVGAAHRVAFARALPSAPITLLPGVGHMPMLEAPAAFAAWLAAAAR